MLKSLLHQTQNVHVIQTVKDVLAILAIFDEFLPTQHPELMADRRRTHLEKSGQITYAKLGKRERMQDAGAGGIPKSLEKVSQIQQHLPRSHLGFDLSHLVRVQACRGAGFVDVHQLAFHLNIYSIVEH